MLFLYNLQNQCVISYDDSFNLINTSFHPADVSHCTPRWIFQHPTRCIGLILNVYSGSSLGNIVPLGFSEMLQNNNGALLHGFAGNLGTSNNLHDELLALYHKSTTFSWLGSKGSYFNLLFSQYHYACHHYSQLLAPLYFNYH